MAVGAITEAFKIASFSPRTLDPTAAIDLCAPGDAVTAPITAGSMGACWAGAYGTSVSAPLVSGIAALRLELAPSRTARSLWDEVVAHCVSQHSYDAKDFGAGIPRAP
jgi:subtilisin family serine protease